MSDKFQWEPGDLIPIKPDDSRERLEEAHGRLFPDEDTVNIPTKELATDIIQANHVVPDPNASEAFLIGQALGYIKEN